MRAPAIIVALALALAPAHVLAQEIDGEVFSHGVVLPVPPDAAQCKARQGSGCVCLTSEAAQEALVRLRMAKEPPAVAPRSWLDGPSWTVFGGVVVSVAVLAGVSGYLLAD